MLLKNLRNEARKGGKLERAWSGPYTISKVLPKGLNNRTIARWIMSVLQSAGIDTSKFKAHSVRGAATSNASVTGTPVADILKMADWSSAEHVFCRYYLRDVLE